MCPSILIYSLKLKSEVFFNLKYNIAIPSQTRDEDVDFDYDSVSSASGTESEYELSDGSEFDMFDIETENKSFQCESIRTNLML